MIQQARRIIAEIDSLVDKIVGELFEPLNIATNRECGVANLMADMLRERLEDDVAVITANNAFTRLLLQNHCAMRCYGI
jgi:hypothetical protein